ncbi:hypothetical protein ACFQAT_07795 [Undibacterium arcticum]|uniref:hypothetical protein n=1 Tax=Undibacterium arcticum TaxID=1762892 RepID=UPI0036118501
MCVSEPTFFDFNVILELHFSFILIIKGFNITNEDSDTYGIHKENSYTGRGPELMGVNTLIGGHVHNVQNERLGDIKEIILDSAEISSTQPKGNSKCISASELSY